MLLFYKKHLLFFYSISVIFVGQCWGAERDGSNRLFCKAVVSSPLVNVYSSYGDCPELLTQLVYGERVLLIDRKIVDTCASAKSCSWVKVEALEQPGISGWIVGGQVSLVTDFSRYNCISWGIQCPMMTLTLAEHAVPWVECGVMAQGTPVEDKFATNKNEWFKLSYWHDQASFTVPRLLCSIPSSDEKVLRENIARSYANEFVCCFHSGNLEELCFLRSYITSAARKFIGSKYLKGGRSFSRHARGEVIERGFDEAGFVSFVYRLAGLLVPRSMGMLFEGSVELGSAADLEDGDLIFLVDKNGQLIRVGMYVGDNKVIESRPGGVQEKQFEDWFGIVAPKHGTRFPDWFSCSRDSSFLSSSNIGECTVYYRTFFANKDVVGNMRKKLLFIE